MQEFIYLLKPVRSAMLAEGPDAAESQALDRHFDYLNGLLADNRAILFGRTQTTSIHTFGIVILEAPNEATAREMMNADPAVKEGVMSATLFPYKIAGMRGR